MINIWTNSLKSKHTESTGSINIFSASPIHGKKPEKPIFAISFIWFRTTTTFHNKICKEVSYQWNSIIFHRFLDIYVYVPIKNKYTECFIWNLKKKIIPTKWQIQGGYANFTILRIIFPFSEIQTLNKLRPLGEN